MRITKKTIFDIGSIIAVVLMTLLFCLDMTVYPKGIPHFEDLLNALMLLCILFGVAANTYKYKKINKAVLLFTALFFIARFISYRLNHIPVTYGGTMMLQGFYLIGISKYLFGGTSKKKIALYTFLAFDIWAMFMCFYNYHYRPELAAAIQAEYAEKGMSLELTLFQNINYAGMMGGAAVVICLAFILNEKFNIVRTILLSIIICTNVYMIFFYTGCRSAETGIALVVLLVMVIYLIKRLDSVRAIVGATVLVCFISLIPLYALVYWNDNEEYLNLVSPLEYRLADMSSGRYAIWKMVILSQEDAELFGYGNIKTSQNKRDDLIESFDMSKMDEIFLWRADHKRQHNGYLALVNEAGIIGAAVFLLLLLARINNLRGSFSKGQWEYLLVIYILWINLFEAKLINTSFFSGFFLMVLLMPNDCENISTIKNIRKRIKKKLDFSEEGRRQKIISNPPAIKDDSIVIVSHPDYTGNPKALFQYMIDHNYNEKYKITWLFNKREDFFKFDIPNVSSVNMKNEKGKRTPEAQKAIISAKYVIYSHNVNWCKKYRDEQTFINLWHGSAYKGPHQGDKVIYFDYLMVTGKKFIGIFRDYMKHKEGEIVDLGYPRNEFLFTDRSGAKDYLEKLKAQHGADKAVIWMPTFRKSTIKRLDSDTNLGESGLPILYNQQMIADFDAVCRENKVMLIIKQHFMQIDYQSSDEGLDSIMFLTDRELLKEGVDLYELIGKTDAMISDYSSASIDYMLTDRPIGYTLDDFDKYEEARGWAFVNITDYMPGHHIYTSEELATFIGDVSASRDPHREWRAKVTEEFHTYRDGFSERILEYFGI